MIELEDLKRPPVEFPSYGRRSFGPLTACPECGFRVAYVPKAEDLNVSLFDAVEADKTECAACKTEYEPGANIVR